MQNFEIILIGRNVKISFNHPKFVIAEFQAQSISFACQGNQKIQSVSIEKKEYTLEKLEKKIESEWFFRVEIVGSSHRKVPF